MVERVYVKVDAVFYMNGDVFPKAFSLANGKRYEIKALADIKHADSPKKGINYSRYSCLVNGDQMSIYREGDRWFVERKI